MGKPKEALKYLQLGLKIPLEIYGPESTDVGVALSYMGDAMKESGNLISALQYYQQALQIFKKFFKPDHHLIEIHLKFIEEINHKIQKIDAKKRK